MNKEVKGKRVLITGGTTGIGRATAKLLVELGARVIIFGRHQEELCDALDDIEKSGEIYGLTADVANFSDVQKVFEAVDNKLGGIDVLVNNAALAAESVLSMEYEDWKYVVDTNLAGYMLCAKEAAERMETAGEGHIVSIGSLSAKVREEDSDVYVATKAGIRGFLESFRKK